MFKLMNLELQKRDKPKMLKTLVWNWILISVLCIGLVSLIILTSEVKVPTLGIQEMQQDFGDLLDKISIKGLVDTITAISFMIYAGVNYARFVVKDFTDAQLEQLFSYPISRTKIMYSKILLAALITMGGMILTKISAYAFVSLLGYGFEIRLLTLLEIITSSLAVVLLAQVAMAVGIWKKSTIATLVTAFLLGAFTQGNIGTIQLSDFPMIAYSGAVVGIIVCVRFVQKMNDFEFFN